MKEIIYRQSFDSTMKRDALHIADHMWIESTNNLIQVTVVVTGLHPNGVYKATFNSRWQLTHWGRDKMDAIRRRHFQVHFLEWKCIHYD